MSLFQHHIARRAVAVLFVSAIAALLIWRSIDSQDVPISGNGTSMQTSAEADTAPVRISDPDEIDEINKSLLRVAEGIEKRPGAPVITNPRAEALRLTAELTLEELVWSLGDLRTSRAYALVPGRFSPESAAWFASALPNNIQVARLIEEGRRNPERVSALLQDRVMRICSGSFRKQDSPLPLGYVDHPDAVINTFVKAALEKKVASHEPWAVEQQLIEELLYAFPPAILFIMVNMNDDTALDIVAAILKDAPEPFSRTRGRTHAPSNGILVWAVDAFLSRWREEDLPEDARPFLAKHKELTGGASISPGMKVSSWTAAWDVNDIFVMMLDLDVSDMKTIDVIGIDHNLDRTISLEKGEEILKNFMDLYATTGRKWEAVQQYLVNE